MGKGGVSKVEGGGEGQRSRPFATYVPCNPHLQPILSRLLCMWLFFDSLVSWLARGVHGRGKGGSDAAGDGGWSYRLGLDYACARYTRASVEIYSVGVLFEPA